MKDSDEVFLLVYFYGGNTGHYRMSFKLAKWVYQEYKAWIMSEDREKKSKLITLDVNNLEEGPHFFRCEAIVGINTVPIDVEQEFLQKQQMKEQISTMKKFGKLADDATSSEDWKK